MERNAFPAMMTLYSANCIGNQQNCRYPNKAEISSEAAFRRAVSHDYVAVLYRDGYRNKENYLGSDTLAMDCDNDHSDREEDWITPEKVMDFFQDVSIGFHFSRNHMKQKGNRSARPRFHCFFALRPTESAEAYAALKRRVASLFPYFDQKALDAARFFYGTSDPQVRLYPGSLTLEEWMELHGVDAPDASDASVSMAMAASRDMAISRAMAASWDRGAAGNEAPQAGKPLLPAPGQVRGVENAGRIPEGERNSTLHRYALRLLKALGNTKKAGQLFLKKAEKCDPPLERKELATIWKSAHQFWKEKICTQPDYVPPEVSSELKDGYLFLPSDKSDVAEAQVLAEAYLDRLRYSPGTDFLIYDGKVWEENKPRAHALMHRLSEQQLKEATTALARLNEEAENNGLNQLLTFHGNNAMQYMNEEQKRTFFELEEARSYKKIAMQYRQSRNIKAVLEEVQPMILIKTEALDRDAYLLNTPEGTFKE